MSRSRRLTVFLTACITGLLGAGLAFPMAAAASSGPIVPRLAGPLPIDHLFASTLQAKTVTASYSCDFSAYGTGIQAATVSATYTVPTSWPVSQPMGVELDTDAITLPSAVSSALSGVDSFTVDASVTAQHAKQATVDVSGAVPVSTSAAPTQVPQGVALGQVTFPAKGTGTVKLPASTITVTPMMGSTAQKAITCTTTQAAQDVSITVGNASGPFYNCVETVAPGSSHSVSATFAGPIAMTVTASGTKQVGKTVTVQLSSDDIAAFIVSVSAALDAVSGVQVTKVTFASRLAVTGAQSGTLSLPATVTDVTATSFSASGTLKLTKAGNVTVHIPSKWALDFLDNTAKLVDITCTLVTKPAPAGATIASASGHGSGSGSGSGSGNGGSGSGNGDNGGQGEDNGATQENTGTTPVGGANTGGGASPGADAPLAIGAAALLLAGGGLVLQGARQARRRRRP